MREIMKLVESHEHPDIMFHGSSPDNRNSIQTLGLSCRFSNAYDPNDDMLSGAIYFTTKQDSEFGGSDVWAVNVSGLDLDRDYDDHDEEEMGEWWVCWGRDIEPARLRLISPH